MRKNDDCIKWDNPAWEYFTIQKLRGQNFAGEWPTIPEFLQYTIEHFPDNPAFTSFSDSKQTITYGKLGQYVESIARALQNLGLQFGDKIAIIGKNSPAWGLVYLASLCAGCVVVPLDVNQSTAFQQHLLKFVEAKVVFLDCELSQKFSGSYHKFVLQNSSSGTNIWDLLEQYKKQLHRDLRALASLSCNDLAALLTTSGTTGNEKLAMLTHANFTSNVIQSVYPGLQQIFATDRFYLLLPMHHSYPMTAVFLESISHGSEIIFPRGLAIQQIIQDLKDGRVTVFMGIPRLFNKILQGVLQKVKVQGPLKNFIFHSLLKISDIFDRLGKPIGSKLFAKVLQAMGFEHIRILLSGAGVLMPEVGKKYRQLGLDFIQGYGLTEAAPIVTLNPAGTTELRSVGRLLPLVSGRLEQMQEQTVEGYSVGELCIDGPNKMQGYYKNLRATEEIFTEDGWLRTGDMGYFDSKGYFYITGRCKNVIINSSGKNIYPEEIEELFQLNSIFEQVMVRGYQEQDTEKVELVIHPKLLESTLSELSQIDQKSLLTNEKNKLGEIFDEIMQKKILSNVAEVNKKLLAYQKISRIRLVLVPLDMTTTQKIKRFLVEQRLAKYDDGLILES